MKDFERWHNLKCEIDAGFASPIFNEREIWWCSVGTNIGVEEDGKNDLFERPVLVLYKFSKDGFWGVPLSSKRREGRFYFPVAVSGRPSTVLLSQLRFYSSKRLMRRIEKMTDSQFDEVRLALEALVFFTKRNPARRGGVSRVPNGNCNSIIPEQTDSSNTV